MMGIKEREFRPLPDNLSLEELVPKDNFYRRLEATLDLSFVRDLVRDCYASSGRPSVDPVVFFRLQLVMFFEDIRSERQLMEVAADRLSVRWFVGYDLNDPLPDHSSLTRIRERYGLQTFRRFFERIVELCVEARVVWGKELYFDATKVEANASLDSMRSRSLMEHGLEEHLASIFPEEAQPQEGANTLEPPLWNPPVRKVVKRSRRQTRASTVGSPRPDASSGTWFGGATGDWQISGQAPPTWTLRRCNARRKARAG
jgi:transposase